MTPPRKGRPTAFRLDDPSVFVDEPDGSGDKGGKTPRSKVLITPEPEDPFAEPAGGQVTKLPRRRGFRFGRLFMAAAGALLSLAVGIWVTDFVAGLFARADWLGWVSFSLALLAALALLALLAREAAGLMRLARVTRLRAEAEDAAASDDRDAARKVASEIIGIYAKRPEFARSRVALQGHLTEIIDGRDLLRLAEREMMTRLDSQARALVTASAQRVSVVTAVSPRAIVDILFVAYESLRLIRGIGTLYGGRPSGLALFRLTRMALAHLALTGGIAMTDGLMQQIVGHGLAARLSARLGEGVINGLMTARIGLAALDVCRPLPWLSNRPPGLRDVMSALVGTGGDNKQGRDQAESSN